MAMFQLLCWGAASTLESEILGDHTTCLRQSVPPMVAEGKRHWPKGAHTLGNAGVTLVGHSAEHGNVPAALLGGRFYTGKRKYWYTDFGGGVDRKRGETPQQGAFREFVEEFFGLDGAEAKTAASKLCEATTKVLVGARPFVHGAYVMFVVAAEAVVEALQLSKFATCTSAIDLLLDSAKRNSELSSIALVSIEEMLRGALNDGWVRPLSVRQLDGESRNSDEIELRPLMVGTSGSILTVRDALERFADEPIQLQPSCAPQPDLLPITNACCQQVDAMRLEEFKMAITRYIRMAPSLEPIVPTPSKLASQVRAQSRSQQSVPYVFDMETGDPDDVLTLLFLCSHPAVELRAVTITPGSEEQVALVRWLLEQVGVTHLRLGAQDWPTNAKKTVNLSTSFYKGFGRSHASEPRCERADKVLLECCDEGATLVTGAALHNLGAALKMDGFRLGRWVAQGGFAGEGVVPGGKQMDKFQGKVTCPTWNFGGNIPAAQAALATEAIARKICVSKNVCHSVVYDEQWHEALGAAAQAETRKEPRGSRALAFGLMHKAMEEYLRRKPGGKKLHDPLALAVALDESVCELAEVQLFCQKGQWGSRLCPGSDVWISVDYDAIKFQAALLR
eukprot:CAMPEP_0115410616 /NCGR_PEP_ID=MMETSP0271-20121206/20611_1 /TAXON_ID=71861 /ORGANISM="Scrippsiella trochoidea, Strain CCMP3099" /LENGTH=619 /DNA_ID=CAMNT_0002834799 /DNA_START=159 /DNA_END=2018 /DNA_ORIENTATION=-